MSDVMYLPLTEYIQRLWPADLLDPPALDQVEGIWFEPPLIEHEPGFRIRTALLFEQELALSIPGLAGVKLVLAASDTDSTFMFELDSEPAPTLRIVDIPLGIRIASDLLKPARAVLASNGQVERIEVDPTRQFVDISVAQTTLSIDLEGNLGIDSSAVLNLPLCLIGDTGIALEANNIQFFGRHDAPPAGKPAGWRGIFIPSATLAFPGELASTLGTLTISNSYIGNGGFSGDFTTSWSPAKSATLGGFTLSLDRVTLGFVQNVPTGVALAGRIIVPFLDQPLPVEISVAIDGSFLIKVAQTSGLYTLTRPDVCDLEIDSIGFALDNGVFTATLSGQLTPRFGGLDWPSFKVEQLAIDSQGNVKLEGGWLNLRDQYSLDFHGFQLEITRLGFGKTEDGGKWIGCSGALKLVEGLPAGASVEGLRVIWYDDPRPTKITLEGVGVEFTVPDVLRFKGAVSYRAASNRFDGAITLELLVLGLEIDATLVVGSEAGDTYFAIYLAAELPAGIPLAATGLGIYGLAGLFAHEMAPDKLPTEEWYEGWYQRGTPGVTDLANKWTNRDGSMALGAGITLGTVADNGFIFSGKMLLVVSFPGPIILIEGKANLLKKRTSLNDNPTFRALAVLDAEARTFLVGLDAQYMYGDSGQLIDIHGGAEVFFDFEDAGAWHLYLGERDPREKRIRAEIFRFFGADAYLMLDPHQLALGAWVGYARTWRFGPLRVTIESWIEGNAMISVHPAHFHGDLWMHGRVDLSVFGFGLGLSVDARIAADVFDPFHLLAGLSVGINLPWPLPDFDVDVTIEWGPEKVPPPLPLPLQEIAIEHLKVTTSWPLPRGTLLLPNYDSNGDGMIESASPSVAVQEAAPPPANAPIVPLDCRPHLTFARPVWDDAMVGLNPKPPDPEWEQIGDPANNVGPVKVRYGLQEIALEQYVGGVWQVVAAAPEPEPDDPGQEKKLYGSWAPIPALPNPGGDAVAQVKLWLWSKTPFNYTRHASNPWDDWFLLQYDDYLCASLPPEYEICCDFAHLVPGRQFSSPWQSPLAPIRLSWSAPTLQQVSIHQPLEGRTHALCFPMRVTGTNTLNEVTIQIGQPAKRVRLIVSGVNGVQATGYDAQGRTYGPVVGGRPDRPWVEIDGQDLVRVIVRGYSDFCIFGICIVIGLTELQASIRQEHVQHTADELAQWSKSDMVLKPHTNYRIRVVTTLQARGQGALDDYTQDLTQTEFAYFQTAGPPGLAALALPSGHPNPSEFASGLDDLRNYVRQTIPMSVLPAGEPPLLPRPVYRAYDVGVEFNENYVDLMYRLDGRDLGLYLYNNSNQPVRDVQGRLIVLSNRWSQAETIELSASEERWMRLIDASNCLPGGPTIEVLPDPKLTSVGLLLAPDMLYEARLVPLLLHESWSGYAATPSANGPSGTLGSWMIRDQGSDSAPSHWEVQSETLPPRPDDPDPVQNFFIVQTTQIWGGPGGADLVKPGTLLLRADNPSLSPAHPEQPGEWTDYRLSVYLRAADGGAMGLVFRYRDTNNYYRFSIEGYQHYRRLVKVAGGAHMLLAADDFSYEQNRDYLITIEAIGSSIRVYQDGELIFDVADSAHNRGRMGLYCWANRDTRFSDVRVDDFRRTAPVVYRFGFTTSKFANFFHQLHSYQDETWRILLGAAPSDSAIAALVDEGALPADPLRDAETRAYDSLAEQILGPAAWQRPAEVQITRIERGTTALALLVQSPEPIDWRRTSLEVEHAAGFEIRRSIPGAVKLTDITLGAQQPNQESVTLLLRESVDLSGYRIEYGLISRPGFDPLTWEPYYTFGAEQRLPAGTRVQVYAGNQAQAGPATPGVQRRFIASGSASGQLTFPADGVSLRLVDPNGHAGHKRGFLRAGAYSAITGTTCVLRKADGTGFFILVPSSTSAGSTISAGRYRLKLTYRRDNQAIDPDSPILREAGSSTPEEVVIDIPWSATQP